MYQGWFMRALGNGSVRMVPPDSDETAVGMGQVASVTFASSRSIMRVNEAYDDTLYQRAPLQRVASPVYEYREPEVRPVSITRAEPVYQYRTEPVARPEPVYEYRTEPAPVQRTGSISRVEPVYQYYRTEPEPIYEYRNERLATQTSPGRQYNQYH